MAATVADKLYLYDARYVNNCDMEILNNESETGISVMAVLICTYLRFEIRHRHISSGSVSKVYTFGSEPKYTFHVSNTIAVLKDRTNFL